VLAFEILSRFISDFGALHSISICLFSGFSWLTTVLRGFVSASLARIYILPVPVFVCPLTEKFRKGRRRDAGSA